MDKRNMIPTRPRVVQQIRPRANLPSGSFIALGGRPNTPDASSASAQLAGPSALKREAGAITPSMMAAPPKKPRIGVDSRQQTASPSSNISTTAIRREIPVENLWQTVPSDVSPSTFAQRLEAAEAKNRPEKAERLVLGLAKFLYEHRSKAPDPNMAAQFSMLAREKPHYFRENLIEALCAVLRKPVGVKVTARCHPLSYQLVCSVLYRALQFRDEWPETLVKTYLDDALTERSWVDRKDCQHLVQNILTAFGTDQPSPEFFAYLYFGEGSRSSMDRGGAASPVHTGASPLYEDDRSRDGSDAATVLAKLEEEEKATESVAASTIGAGASTPVVSPARFTKTYDSIRNYAIELLRDWWSRRLDTVPKGLVKTMAACCGYHEVRLASAQKLDAWLQNAKLQRTATELMMAVCINFKEHLDMEALSCMTRLRFKSRVVANNFCFILKELFAKVPSSLPIVLKMVVHNELSTTRAPHNMLIIGQCFQFSPDVSSQTLATICFELLSSTKEDYARVLRAFLREVVRNALKFDFPMNSFSQALMQERPIISSFDQALKERVFHALEDLVCLTAFIAIGPSLRDVALAVGRGDRREIAVLNAYQRNVRQLQSDAVAWLHQVVPAAFRPSKEDYLRCLYRVTFLEKPEFYSSKDNWPTDQERNLYLRIISESGLEEDLLLRVLTVGLSSDNALSPAAALEVAEQLVRRTAVAIVDPKFRVADTNSLKITNLNVIDLIFNCCRYRPPESYQLPINYSLPMLAITKSFWQSTNILLMLAAYNPSLIGRIIWENYPTLQYLMENVISEDYNFPPATVVTGSITADDVRRQDLQVHEAEKHEILELEGYLATNQITESNSSLLMHLMRLEPKGVPRRPPQSVLDSLKHLNQQINLGLTFCRSRDPDFLLEIIHRQGSSHSLPWLIQLIQKNEGSLRLLPVQCLCEFLLHHLENERRSADDGGEIGTSGHGSQLFQNSHELRQRLIDVVWEPSTDSAQVESTLLYFFNRLQADTNRDRKMALYALEILLKPPGNAQGENADQKKPPMADFGWLLNGFPAIPRFSYIRGSVVGILSKCVMVETALENLRAYIEFMHKHAVDEELDDVALNLGKMIYGRRTLIDRLLPHGRLMEMDVSKTLEHLLDIFKRHMTLAQSTNSSVFSWSASQDLLLVQWGEASSANMNVNVVAAMLLLLGYPKPEGASESYDKLLEDWFPKDVKPTAYMLDTSEEAELIPEDVKFQLICSSNEFIVDTVLKTMDDRQVLTCIEYSGLPVQTISKVCATLDSMVMNNKAMLNEMRARAETWLSCLTAHGVRGAEIGEHFMEWCRTTSKDMKGEPEEQMDTGSSSKTTVPATGTTRTAILDESSIREVLAKAFYKDESIDVAGKRDFLALWSRLLVQLTSVAADQRCVIEWLMTEMTSKATEVANGLNRRQEWAVSLFRLLEQRVSDDNLEAYSSLCRLLIKENRLNSSISSVMQKCKSAAIDNKEEKMDFEQAGESKSLDLDEEARAKEILRVLEQLRSGSVECEEADVDRVLRMDPEIAKVTPWKQLEYLFGTNNAVGLRHLLSLLPHYGHVDTLRNVVEKLLSCPGNTYDFKKVLDFIAAIIDLPRLWTGREPKLPRHYQRENILQLSQSQLENLLHYIVSELATVPPSLSRCDCPSTSESLSKSRMDWRPHEPFASGVGVDSSTLEGKLQGRLKLLLECCQNNLKPVVRWLLAAASSGYDQNVIQLLLLELYFAKPDIYRFIPDLSILRDLRCLVHSGHTSLDATLFRILSAAARFAENEQNEKDLEQVDAKLMEIASAHPTIVVRHTPLIAAYLRSTTGFSIRKYDRTNYLEWYDMLLNLLDTLRPTIFDVHYVDSVLDMMKSYFDFIQNHGLRSGKYIRLVEKVVKFICAFHDHQQTLVSQFLQSYSTLIQALTTHYAESSTVRQLKKICC